MALKALILAQKIPKITIHTAINFSIALSIFQDLEAQSNYFDYVFIDMNMPDKKGDEVLKETDSFRSKDKILPQVFIVTGGLTMED